MLKPLIAVAMLLAGTSAFAADTPLTAAHYAQQLGVGMDVDWARTDRGIREFDPLVVRDFYEAGIRHVRIRVADNMTEARLIHLRKLVEACEAYGVIPIIAYQADSFKADPDAKNEAQLVVWWKTVGTFFGTDHPTLGFDVIYEPADKLNHDLSALNRAYENVVRTLHDIDPQRMIFIAPRMRAAPEDLPSLKLPPHSQNFLLAEWHIFPWGPLKANGKYPWTSGTAAEKAAIRARINTAVRWQQKTGHTSWVGGWAVGESMKSAPTESQLAFARFMACELNKVKIPYAINTDTQFYDGEEGAWRPAPEPLLKVMITPDCCKPDAKSGHHEVKSPVRGEQNATPTAASTAGSKARPASSASQG
ncbi:cellulase family glycosylhydrolase [Kosakonia sp.]|uniref:cellulase family glycosylhydrolase n=1 Tax=Kosakonia sp. TaxID=1916651 RepID=UPI0028B0D91B|nr:cellulase family glycosylhydrolase [Kosakonia sp.]